MPIEKRTRVETFLPIRSDLTAYEVSLDWLAEDLAFIRGGATLTTPFSGLYVSSTRIDVVQDAIRILFCDFDAIPKAAMKFRVLSAIWKTSKSF